MNTFTTRRPVARPENLTTKDALTAIMHGRPSHTAIRHFVGECHKVAVREIYRRLQRGHLMYQLTDLSAGDLALDCIAELFQRDEADRFSQLVDYFEGCRWEEMSTTELQAALRTLVTSKVTEGLFRMYREIDPTLSKIIRNLKIAVKSETRFSTTRKGRRLWFVLGPEERTELPLLPTDLLQSYLAQALMQDNNVPNALRAFASVLDDFPMYRNSFPLSQFATCIRTALQPIAATEEHASAASEVRAPCIEAEVVEAVHFVTDAIRTEKYITYVSSGKIDVSTFDAYVEAVKDILIGSLHSEYESADSYYDALSAHMASLSKSTYQESHRHIFEYLAKLSREKLVRYYRQDYFMSAG